MKFACSQSDLKANLSLVSRAVPSRPALPVLGHVLLLADATAKVIQVRAFDNELGIQTSFEAEVETSGAVSLPAKTLSDIVSRLPEGSVELAQDEEAAASGLVSLSTTSGRYQLRSLPAAEFPELPIVTTEEAIALPVSALLDGLRSTLFAASTEETKQVLTGIHVKFGPDKVEFAATDGHRLAVLETSSEVEGEAPTEELEVTIPARALRELERILALQASDDRVELRADERQVIFASGQQRLTSRRLDGAYPAYQQLIPQQFGNRINLDRRQLQSALERIAVLAEQKNNVVKFTFDEDQQQLHLSVDAQDVGSGRESMPAQMDSSEPGDIAFNVKYLMDGLKALASHEISLCLNSATQPAIFRPVSGLKMTYLAMPVQLRD